MRAIEEVGDGKGNIVGYRCPQCEKTKATYQEAADCLKEHVQLLCD